MKKPRRPEDILTDEVRVSPIASAEGVLMMRNNSAKGIRIGGTNPELFGLGEGSADLILCVRGRFCGLELKTKAGSFGEKQMDWCRKVQMAGGEYLVAKTVEEANRLVDRVNQIEVAREDIVYAARRWFLCRMTGNTLDASHWQAQTMDACGRIDDQDWQSDAVGARERLGT